MVPVATVMPEVLPGIFAWHYYQSLMAFDKHYSLNPVSPAAMNAHRDDLRDLVTGKGTISFACGSRLPVTLVEKVMKTRLAGVAGKPQRSNDGPINRTKLVRSVLSRASLRAPTRTASVHWGRANPRAIGT